MGLPALVSDGEAELWAAAWGRPPGEVAILRGRERRPQDQLSVRGPGALRRRPVGRAGAYDHAAGPALGGGRPGAASPSWPSVRTDGRILAIAGAAGWARPPRSGAARPAAPVGRSSSAGRADGFSGLAGCAGGASVRLSINRMRTPWRRRMWPKGTRPSARSAAGPGRGAGWCRAALVPPGIALLIQKDHPGLAGRRLHLPRGPQPLSQRLCPVADHRRAGRVSNLEREVIDSLARRDTYHRMSRWSSSRG